MVIVCEFKQPTTLWNGYQRRWSRNAGKKIRFAMALLAQRGTLGLSTVGRADKHWMHNTALHADSRRRTHWQLGLVPRPRLHSKLMRTNLFEHSGQQAQAVRQGIIPK